MRYPSTEPVVITCALTGGIHGKEANPNLPEQPDEIVAQGIAAWRAGAAILHVHARNPDGSNTMDPAIYGELHQRLCAETDAIVQLTTGGSPTLPVEQRLNTVLLAPEMASLNLGLLNFFIRGERVFFSNNYCMHMATKPVDGGATVRLDGNAASAMGNQVKGLPGKFVSIDFKKMTVTCVGNITSGPIIGANLTPGGVGLNLVNVP